MHVPAGTAVQQAVVLKWAQCTLPDATQHAAPAQSGCATAAAALGSRTDMLKAKASTSSRLPPKHDTMAFSSGICSAEVDASLLVCNQVQSLC